VEEERIKSALEIAMEKVSRLPELTPEEIAEQKEKEFRPIGRALGSKYLLGQISEDEMKSELSEYPEEKSGIVRRALIECICRSLQLEDNAKADRVLKGLASLGEENLDWSGIRHLLERIRQDFEREKQIIFKKYESILKHKLEAAGIRGSAVHPNLAVSDDWLQTLNGICRAYEPKLKEIRKAGMIGCMNPSASKGSTDSEKRA